MFNSFLLYWSTLSVGYLNPVVEIALKSAVYRRSKKYYYVILDFVNLLNAVVLPDVYLFTRKPPSDHILYIGLQLFPQYLNYLYRHLGTLQFLKKRVKLLR